METTRSNRDHLTSNVLLLCNQHHWLWWELDEIVIAADSVHPPPSSTPRPHMGLRSAWLHRGGRGIMVFKPCGVMQIVLASSSSTPAADLLPIMSEKKEASEIHKSLTISSLNPSLLPLNLTFFFLFFFLHALLHLSSLRQRVNEVFC